VHEARLSHALSGAEQVALDGAEGGRTLTVTDAVALPAPAAVAARGRRALVPGERDSIYRRLLALADAGAAAGALTVAVLCAFRHPFPLATFATVPLIVVLSKLLGTYDREDMLMRKSSLDESPALFQLGTLYALGTWLIDRLLISGSRDTRELLVVWVAVWLLLIVFRALARWLARSITLPERCLVLGQAADCQAMHQKFERRRALHAVVVAGVELEELELSPESALASRQTLEELRVRFAIDRLIVTPGAADEATVGQLARVATSLGMKISILPSLLQTVGSTIAFDDVEGLPLLSMRPLRLSRSSELIKRTVDVAGALLSLAVLSPLMALVALAIRLDSPGPVLFRQQRIGREGRAFSLIKFRTMVVGAEGQKEELRHLNEAGGLFKIAADPRITRVGRWLRRTAVDELPQLVNVLRGEMSLVGPRPLVAEEDRRIVGWHRRRLNLKPGMTGHWQILGSARIPLEEMVQIDYLYVSNWSLWLDVKILLRTIPYVLGGRGM